MNNPIKQLASGGSVSKESACNAEDPGSAPESSRSPGEGNGNPLQCSHLGNPMDNGTRLATVHEAAKSWTRLHGQNNSHQDSMVLAQRQKYRSMEQNIKPRDKSMHIWTRYP